MSSSDLTHVLLIEDRPEHRALVRSHLFPDTGDFLFRYQLHEAETFEQGLKELDTILAGTKNAIDPGCVVLLDLELPDSNCEKTMDSLPDLSKRVPVLVLTSLDEHELGEKMIIRGAQDYIPKMELTPALIERSIRYARYRFRQMQELALLNNEMRSANLELVELGNLIKEEIFDSLRSLQVYRRMVSDEFGDTNALQEMVDKTLRALTSLDSVTEQAFDYANMGFVLLPFTVCKVNEILEEVLQEVAEDKSLVDRVHVDRCDYIPPVMGHVARLRRVFLSLLGLFAAGADSPSTVVRVELCEVSDKVTFRFSGMVKMAPEHDGRHAFYLFRKLYSSSMGVALYVAQQCIERMSGSVWVESSASQGLSVFISLPLAK